MYFLRSVKKCSHVLTPKCTQIYLLFNCVFPCFIYGIQIWSCHNLNGLAVKQKSAIRIINGENYNAHTAPRFKKSAILPIAMLVEFFKLQFMHNFLNNFL